MRCVPLGMGLLALLWSFAADASGLTGQLAGLSFLVGHWSSGHGFVSDTGGTSTGASVITVEAGGAVLLRQDHTDIKTKSGAPAGAFDQIMMIYPEGGTIRADYSDGAHVIHYMSAEVVPGRSVIFTSAVSAAAPVFRLGYRLSAPGTLAVSFGMVPPGGGQERPIAVGTLLKAKE